MECHVFIIYSLFIGINIENLYCNLIFYEELLLSGDWYHYGFLIDIGHLYIEVECSDSHYQQTFFSLAVCPDQLSGPNF